MDKITSLIEFFGNLGPVGWGIFAVGLVLIWLKWRLINWASKKGRLTTEAGWKGRAGTLRQQRTIGIDDEEMHVVHFPSKLFWIGVFTTVMFGAVAWGLWPSSLAEFFDGGFRDMIGMASGPLFAIGGVFIIFMSRRKIIFGRQSLTLKRAFLPDRSVLFSDISAVDFFNGRTPTSGLKLITESGRPIKIPATMIGIGQLARALAPNHRKAAMAAMINRAPL